MRNADRDLGEQSAGSTAVVRGRGSAAGLLLFDLDILKWASSPEESEATRRYAYRDLGEQPAGSTAVVRWRGSAADVVLLDPVNFGNYSQARTPVFFSGGGRYRRSPARLSIPEDGRWYVVADLGPTSTEATVEVLEPKGGKPKTPKRSRS